MQDLWSAAPYERVIWPFNMICYSTADLFQLSHPLTVLCFSFAFPSNHWNLIQTQNVDSLIEKKESSSLGSCLVSDFSLWASSCPPTSSFSQAYYVCTRDHNGGGSGLPTGSRSDLVEQERTDLWSLFPIPFSKLIQWCLLGVFECHTLHYC